MEHIAKIYTNFKNKFGIPRQSGLVHAPGMIVFEPKYRNPDCIRGLDEFSHIWLIWEFSEHLTASTHLTVRPPRLGGNTRVGVFATRSPFRPNPIGLSVLKLEKIVTDSDWGPVLYVSGVDILDETPIYDIKPYLPYIDSIVDAQGGFSTKVKDYHLGVVIPADAKKSLKEEELSIISAILSEDPRPSYQEDPDRIYGFEYSDYNIKFKVEHNVATVCSITKR